MQIILNQDVNSKEPVTQTDVGAGEDLYARIRETIQAGYDQPENPQVFIAQAKAFLEQGFVDNAIDAFHKAFNCAGTDEPWRALLADTVRLRDSNLARFPQVKEVLGHPVCKFLGAGWEGSVYIALDEYGEKCIVKAFHPAFVNLVNYRGQGGIYRQAVKSSRHDLFKLATIVESDEHPLYRIHLIENDDRIVGIQYRYEYLVPIKSRHAGRPDIAKPGLDSFLRSQAHLLKELELCLSDASIHTQFMLALNGRLRYVDYGTTIIPIDDFRCRDDHWEVQALLQMLYSIYKPQHIQHLADHGMKTALDPEHGLWPLAEKHGFIREVLEHIERGRLETFLDFGFYQYLGQNLPQTIPMLTRGRLLLKHYRLLAFTRIARQPLPSRM